MQEREQRNYDEYCRYHESVELRMYIDELTEASEKLAMVMNNPFAFAMGADGDLHAEDGSNLGKVLRDSVVAAEQLAITNPQFMTELIRRRIELQEYDEQRRLALGGEGDPDVLVVISPIPDAVAHQGVDLGAYDTDRMKTLVRICKRTQDGMISTSISLDGTDRAGLQAIARQFGQTIHDDDGSEDILAMRFWGYSSVLGDPVKTVRRRYDEQLERQHGGEWYGGRQDGDVVDALTFIRQQTDICDAHMERMREINKLPRSEQAGLLKTARHNFAAALDRRRLGGTAFGDGGDLSGSGDAARAAGIEYKGDCPTGEQSQQSAEQAMNTLFRHKNESKEVEMTCPFCGLKTVGDPCAVRLVCGRCSAEVRNGRVVSKGIGRAAALARESEQAAKKEVQEKGKETARNIAKTAIPVSFEHLGEFYERVERIGIGGVVEEIRQISREQWHAQREEFALAA